MSRQVRTNCSICEPQCPILAEVNDAGDVESLAPDYERPYGGQACHKGLGYLSIHNSPDRLNWPLKRTTDNRLADPEFERCDWDDALADISEKVRTCIETYGPNSVALYHGNPLALNSSGARAFFSFRALLKTQMIFNAGTQDSNNHFDASVPIYGASIIPAPDILNTDYALIIGANPKVSKWTLISVPNDSGECLKAVSARGGKVVYVNPQALHDPDNEREETLQIKPDTDAYFLAALIHEIHELDGFDRDYVEKYASNIDKLIEFVAQYPAERVADVVGVDAEELKRIAQEIIDAPSMCIQLSTGPNQGRQGSLCVWLKDMLSLVTGNLGKKGGNFKPFGGIEVPVGSPNHKTIETSIGTLTQNPFTRTAASAVLPDLIEAGDIKILLVFGGNPILSISGSSKLRNAIDKLDLLVTTDISPSATTEMSDYVLPATDWLERDDANDVVIGHQIRPHITFSNAATTPKHERRSDWWMIDKLAELITGQSKGLDEPGADMRRLDKFLRYYGLSVDDVKKAEHQTIALNNPPPESIFERCLHHPDKKLDCCPEAYAEAGLFEQCEAIFAEQSQAPSHQLKLISRRTRHMHNSWHTNLAHMRKGINSINTLHMSEEDAERLSLLDGDMVKVSNQYGAVETRLTVSSTLRPGVVSLTHGYSKYNSKDQAVAAALPGANYNELTPTGPGTYEKFSNMTWMNGVPVEVSLVEYA